MWWWGEVEEVLMIGRKKWMPRTRLLRRYLRSSKAETHMWVKAPNCLNNIKNRSKKSEAQAWTKVLHDLQLAAPAYKKVNIPLHRYGPQTHFKSFAYFLVQQLAESFHSLAKGGQLYATFFSYRSRNLPFSPALGYNSYEPCVSFSFIFNSLKEKTVLFFP